MKQTAVLLFVLVACAILCTSGCNSSPTDVAGGYQCEGCGKIHPTYSPDFEDNTVQIVMTREAGGLNVVHEPAYFGDIGIVSIENLLLVSEGDLPFIDLELFRQRILLTLDTKCKENVLRVVDILKTHEGIQSVSPNYIEFLCEGCSRIHPHITPDFRENTVLVVMTREVGGPNKIHDPAFFGDIGLVSIEDLIKIREHDVPYIDLDFFRQRLLLTLDINCKANVLRVVGILRSIEGIQDVKPVYTEYLCEGCGKIHPFFIRDFCDHNVIVVMTREAGGPNKIHDPAFFGDIGLVSIRDLYTIPEELLPNVNLETFRQILLLTLEINCKANVLRVVDYLRALEGIQNASPNYFETPD
jgi:hypothetical protein